VRSLKKVWIALGAVMMLVIAAFVIFNSYYSFYRVIGDSMEPTLKDGGIYLVRKGVKSIHRGDIIVFRVKNEKSAHISRVIALPGERVAIFDNSVFINGRMLSEPYAQPPYFDIQDVEGFTVPEGHYFVLCDERVEGYDSRHFGPVPQENIIGKIQAER
jgi:signal peptidase I